MTPINALIPAQAGIRVDPRLMLVAVCANSATRVTMDPGLRLRRDRGCGGAWA
jgi:hypothetical protein